MALRQLYVDLGGPSWVHRPYGWGTNSTDFCEWNSETAYVECNSNRSCVTALRFDHVGINGSLSDAICTFTQLVDLEFRNEPGLGGTLPNCTGHLSQIAFIQITGCAMTGPIPEGVFSSALFYLELSCAFTGALPDPTGTVATSIIEFIILMGNMLTGTIPQSYAALPALTTLILSSNDLTGTLPNFGAATNLQVLDVSDNALNGTVTDMFATMVKLNSIDLSLNQFSGPLPPSLGLLPSSAVNLSVSFNSFSGGLEPLLSGPTQFYRLDLSLNALTGSIPDCIAAKTNLSKLILHGNLLSGELPMALLELSQLLVLDLGNNSFSSFAANFSFIGLYNLRALSLRHNDFTSLPTIFFVNESLCPVNNMANMQSNGWSGSLSYLDVSFLAITMYDGGPLSFDDLFGLLILADGDPLSLLTDSGCVNLNMQTLIAQSVGLRGPFMQQMFAVFPNLVNLDMSSNALSGPLPYSYPFFSGTTLPWSLQMLILHSNNFTGTLPAVYVQSLQGNLVILDLRYNPGLYTPRGVLPPFLAASWTIEEDNITLGFVCPQIIERASGSSVLVSSSFYNNTLCRCATNYIGAVAPNGSGCYIATNLCAGTSLGPCASSSGTVLTLEQSFWPYPDPLAATSLVVCPWTSATNLTYCNPNAGVTCTYNATGQNLICGPESALCSGAHRGVLCSECQPGFYNTLPRCLQCAVAPSNYTSDGYAVFFSKSAYPSSGNFGGVLFVLALNMGLIGVLMLSLGAGDATQLRLRCARVSTSPTPYRTFLYESRSVLVLGGAAAITGVLAGSLTIGGPSPVGILAAIAVVSFFTYNSLMSMWLYPLPSDIAARIRQAPAPGVSAANAAPPEVEQTWTGDFAGGIFGAISAEQVAAAWTTGSGALKALLMFWQVVSALSQPAVKWPHLFEIVSAALQPFQLAATLQCSGASVISSLFFSVLYIPLFVVGLVCIMLVMMVPLYLVSGGAKESMFARIARNKYNAPHNSAVLAVMLWAYSNLAVAGSLLNFSEAANGVQYITAMPWIQVGSSDFSHALSVSVCTMLFLVTWILRMLNYLRKHAQRGFTEVSRARYGMLYGSYHPERWWFELVVWARQVLLAVLLAALPQNQLWSVQVGFVVLFTYLGIEITYRPHRAVVTTAVDAVGTGWLIILQASLAYLQSAIGHVVAFDGQWKSFFAFYERLIVGVTITVMVLYSLVFFASGLVLVAPLQQWTLPVLAALGIIPPLTKQHARGGGGGGGDGDGAEKSPLLTGGSGPEADALAGSQRRRNYGTGGSDLYVSTVDDVANEARTVAELEAEIAARETERAAAEAEMLAVKTAHEAEKAELLAEIARLQIETAALADRQ